MANRYAGKRSTKPMPAIGEVVKEIRILDSSALYRVIYIVLLADAVFVRCAFQNKDQRASRRDFDIANGRFGEMMKERG